MHGTKLVTADTCQNSDYISRMTPDEKGDVWNFLKYQFWSPETFKVSWRRPSVHPCI